MCRQVILNTPYRLCFKWLLQQNMVCALCALFAWVWNGGRWAGQQGALVAAAGGGGGEFVVYFARGRRHFS